MAERWYSVSELSDHLGIAPDTIYRWIERRGLPAHRIGRLWKFQIGEVDSWVRAGGAANEDPQHAAAAAPTTSGQLAPTS